MSGTSKQQQGGGGKSPQCSQSVLPEEEADQIVNSGGGEVALKKGIEADQTVNSGGGEVALKKGPWTKEEDEILKDHIKKHGEGNWKAVQKKSGLARCGKSCRLRWSNHLRPGVKKGSFTAEEERLIIECHFLKGTKWAHMAKMLPGRTDNEIKNFWYTRSKKRNRDGLPIYPDEIMSKYSLNDSQESADTLPNESNQHDETETFNFDISDLDLKYYKFRPDMMPPLFDSQDYKPISDLVRQCSDSSHNTLYMPSAVVQQRFFSSSRSAAVPDVFDQYGQYPMLSTPCDPILNTNLLHGYDNPITGFNAASNISSSDPIYGSMTFEPPSFQNSQTQQPTWTDMDVPPLPSFEYVDTPVQAPPIESCPPVADSPDCCHLIDPIDYDHDAIVAAQLNFLRQVRSEIKNTRRYYINRGAFNDQLPAYYTSNKKII
ncbi:unnamed protein product [Lathyrus sativus]|nr:unnamed protein product [Lathyrus sativus]